MGCNRCTKGQLMLHCQTNPHLAMWASPSHRRSKSQLISQFPHPLQDHVRTQKTLLSGRILPIPLGRDMENLLIRHPRSPSCRNSNQPIIVGSLPSIMCQPLWVPRRSPRRISKLYLLSTPRLPYKLRIISLGLILHKALFSKIKQLFQDSNNTRPWLAPKNPRIKADRSAEAQAWCKRQPSRAQIRFCRRSKTSRKSMAIMSSSMSHQAQLIKWIPISQHLLARWHPLTPETMLYTMVKLWWQMALEALLDSRKLSRFINTFRQQMPPLTSNMYLCKTISCKVPQATIKASTLRSPSMPRDQLIRKSAWLFIQALSNSRLTINSKGQAASTPPQTAEPLSLITRWIIGARTSSALPSTSNWPRLPVELPTSSTPQTKTTQRRAWAHLLSTWSRQLIITSRIRLSLRHPSHWPKATLLICTKLSQSRKKGRVSIQTRIPRTR